MKIDEIFDEMDKDLKIGDDLAEESLSIPYKKSKWLRRLFDEQMNNKKLKDVLADLMPVKFEFYSYKQDIKPDRRDIISTYIPSDTEIQQATRNLEMSSKKVELIENIINTINNNSFQIKNAIEWKMFMDGGKHG